MKIFLRVLVLTICALMIFGCGKNSDEEKSAEQANEFQPLKAAGFYGDLRMEPNGNFLVRGKLTEEQSATAGVVYKVEFTDDNKLSKITAMQGGVPISFNWRDSLNNEFTFCAVTVEYPENRVKYNFRSTRMAATPGFYDAYSIAYKVDDAKNPPTAAYMYNKDGEQSSASRGYAQMFFTYDDKGNLVKIAFADDGGNRVTNSGKEYELRLKYADGQITEIANFGKDGSLLVAANGIAKTTFKRDEKNRVVEVRHYGSDEQLKDKTNANLELNKAFTAMSAGAITRYSYDDSGRVKKISFLGKDEQPAGVSDWGNIASLEMTYTPEGWASSIAAFATDDSPIALDKNLFGDNVVKIVCEHDKFGNLSKMIFYGKDNHPVTSSKLGAAECRYRYDDKRRETGQEYYGTGGEKIEVTDKDFKYHGFTYEYNEDDERVLIIFYDTTINEVRREILTPRSEKVAGNAPPAQSPAQPPPQNNPPVQTSRGVYQAVVDRDIDFLALRTGPSTAHSLIVRIPPGAYIQIIRDGSAANNFERAVFNGSVGFVSNRYFTILEKISDDIVPVSPPPAQPVGAVFEAVVNRNIDFLALRTGPSTAYSLILKIPPGAHIEIIRDGSGRNNFDRASYNGSVGFVSNRYFTIVGKIRDLY